MSRYTTGPMELSRSPALALLLLTTGLTACRIETRPPAEVARSQATIQAAVTEHYRARTAFADSLEYRVVRRQAEVRRDLASVWITVRVHRTADSTTAHDTNRSEHLLLRRIDGGWLVLSAAPVTAP